MARNVTTTSVDSEGNGFEVLEVDQAIMKAVTGRYGNALSQTFGSRAPSPVHRIGIGDVLVVAIWEAGGGGLFSGKSDGAQTSALPPQTVDQDGRITLPYAGRIRVAGQTPDQIEKRIVENLKDKAIQPQAIVTVAQGASSTASVSGDVTGAARVPLNVKGDRLMEVVAQSGGIHAAPHETYVRVTRGKKTAEIPVASILANPSENIFIYPGDSIYVYKKPQTFTALGAVTRAGELPIDRPQFTLAQAMGQAGGLNDLQADSTGVFLFRFEDAATIRAVKPDSLLLKGDEPVPVIYRLNFGTPQAYFFAKSFPVRSQDVLYVSDAPSVEFIKAVTVARTVISTLRSIKAIDPNN